MAIDKLTKAEIARRNGALSKGPTSAAGKAKSSANAVTHGLTAQQFFANPEQQAEFDSHLEAVRGHWQPQTSYELYLVTKLARAEFLHDRAEKIQDGLIDLQADTQAAEINRVFAFIDDRGIDCVAYKSLDDNSAAHRNMGRHVARLSRERSRTTELLLNARKHRPVVDLPAVEQPQPPAETAQQPVSNEQNAKRTEPTPAPQPAPRPVTAIHPVAPPQNAPRPADSPSEPAQNPEEPLCPAA
jgi:hypothetical protein